VPKRFEPPTEMMRTTQASMPTRDGGILANRASTWTLAIASSAHTASKARHNFRYAPGVGLPHTATVILASRSPPAAALRKPDLYSS
jgi:hypothetical protein